jgi:hypothetical protein
MLGKDSKTLDNTNHGNENQKKKLLIPGKPHQGQEKILSKLRKSSQGQEKGVTIKKTPSKLREPHKDMTQRTQVTTKTNTITIRYAKKNKMDGRDRMKQDTMRTLP